MAEIHLHDFYLEVSFNYHFLIDIFMGGFIAAFLINKSIAVRWTYIPLIIGACLSVINFTYYYLKFSEFLTRFNQDDLLWDRLFDKTFIITLPLLEGIIISSFFYYYAKIIARD